MTKHLLKTIEELVAIVKDYPSDYARSYNNVFVEINTSNRHYGHTTKVVEIDPYRFSINDLIEAGLGSQNVFSVSVMDYHGFDVEVTDTEVTPITVASELYKWINANSDALQDKTHTVYISCKGPTYDGIEPFDISMEYDGMYWVPKYEAVLPNGMSLQDLPAKDYDLMVLPEDTSVTTYFVEAYEDDPGCGLYYIGYEFPIKDNYAS